VLSEEVSYRVCQTKAIRNKSQIAMDKNWTESVMRDSGLPDDHRAVPTRGHPDDMQSVADGIRQEIVAAAGGQNAATDTATLVSEVGFSTSTENADFLYAAAEAAEALSLLSQKHAECFSDYSEQSIAAVDRQAEQFRAITDGYTADEMLEMEMGGIDSHWAVRSCVMAIYLPLLVCGKVLLVVIT